MKLKSPKPHQIDFNHFHNRTGPYAGYLPGLLGSMAWHEMGLGKTLTALWEARALMAKLRQAGVMAPKFMVICPNSAVHTWKKECHAETSDLLSSMVIYPYSQIHNARKALKYYDLRMIVLDESHKLKSTETDRVKVMAAFFEDISRINGQFKGGRIMLLTGTPLPNNASELYTSWAICGSPDIYTASQRLLDQGRFENWRATFAHKIEMNWVVGKHKPKSQQRRGHGTKYEGVNNEDKLQQLLLPFVHFRQSPPGMTPDPKEILIDLGLDDDKLLENADIERPDYYMAVNERLSRAKIPYMLEWVRDFLSMNGEQLIVFAMNRAPLLALKEAFPKYVELAIGPSDGMTNAQRTANITNFQKGKLRILGTTYAVGSESHNLQNAWINLYHGYPWNDATRRQAMARTNRQGQTRETLHYFMMSGQNDHLCLDRVKIKGATERKVEGLVALNNKELILPSKEIWQPEPVTESKILDLARYI
jgi:SNF2 family DNA or RNA helicase